MRLIYITKNSIFFLLFCLIAVQTSYSQNLNIKFQHLSSKQGLSNASIECILQDSKGFIWFGTQNGLNRFNGYEITSYKYLFNDSTSLPDNFIWCLAEDNDGNIWVGTNENGIAKYRYSSDNFERYCYIEGDSTSLPTQHISALYKDYNGTIWVGTSEGLVKYNAEQDNFTHVHVGDKNTETASISVITEIHDTVLVISTYNKGLYYYNSLKNKLLQYKYISNEITRPINLSIRRLFVDDNTIWFGTQEQPALYQYNTQTKQLNKYTNYSEPNGLKISFVNTIFKDSRNNLWIGGSNEGLALFQDENTPYTSFFHDKSNKYGISSNTITSLYEDNTNTVWLGTHFGGINYFNYNIQSFKHFSHIPNNNQSLSNDIVGCIIEDNDHNIWIGTNNGINLFNKETNQFTFYTPDASKPTVCNHLCPDNKGNIYTGAWEEGLKKFNISTGKFTNLSVIDNGLNRLQNMNIKDVEVDSKGRVWLAGQGEKDLHIFHPDTKEYFHYKKQGYYHPDLFKIKYASDIFEDSKKRIWIASYAGLHLYDDSVKYFKPIVGNRNSISSYYCFTVFEDSDKNIWLGNSNGLDRLVETENDFRVTRYSELYGLPSHIVGILQDNHGYLWLSTYSGLVKFNPATKEHTVFDEYNGLQGNKFKEKAALKSSTGEMYFGGYNGFNSFHPDSIKRNTILPKVYITDLQIFNQSQKPGSSDILNKSILETNYIELTHNHSVFSLEYVAINYIGTEKNQYAYMLEGFDDGWRHVGSERKATYTNIDAGTYTFKVIAANNDGLWNNNAARLTIKILPPWWKTIAFRILFIIVIAGLIYSYIHMRFNRIKEQKKLLAKTVKRRTRELRQLNKKLRKHQKELVDANNQLEEQQEEILQHNETLAKHKYQLEELVSERTEQLVKAKEKAEESDRLKSAFLANMSHEIRTPMNAIVGFSHMLTSDYIKSDDKEKYVKMIRRSCDSLLVLIDDILEVSLIEANQLRFINEWVDMNTLLDETLKYYILNNTKGLELKLKTPENKEFKLYTDANRFKHIITNLLDNAFKYTNEGKVEFGYEIIGNDTRFFVSDTGIGIDKPEYENIFNHFYKIETDKQKLYRGTGLGLSICKNIIEHMKGKIWLESELGKGTTFYFTIPGKPNQNEQIHKAEELPVHINLNDKIVLIAEDEPINFELAKGIIEPTNAKIIWAENGKIAVDIVEKMNNQNNLIILMDIKMPVMTGIEAANNIGKLNKTIPIIALTAYAHESEKRNIMAQNFVEYVSKPITPNKLLKAIEKQI